MADPGVLGQLRAYAADVSDCARSIAVPGNLVSQRDELAEFADQIVREIDAPLRIGFVGEFSAGKSLLLGVLAGKPDLLPTNKHPTTGNVTELHFVQAADGTAPTTVIRARVRFFARPDLTQLDRQSLAELRQAARAARLPGADLAELDAVSAPGAAGLRDWCERAWRHPDAALRKLMRELLVTRAAASSAPGWLGQSIEITPGQLGRVLEIPYPKPSEAFTEAPADGAIAFTENPSDAQLARVFPLVDRVILDMALSRDAWDMSGVHGGNGFVLLDFPGIGGGLTRARDLFLTRRGLEDTHTIVVLVNAERPGGDAPDRFYGFLRELDAPGSDADGSAEPITGRIVYCAGRFDEMPPPELSVGPGGAVRLTEDRLVSASPLLNALMQSGHQPGISAMRAFVSSVLAISRRGMTDIPGDLQFEYYRPGAEAKAAAWQRIAESLAEAATGRDLAAALSAYATDGGVSRLQGLLEKHVRDHGLELRIGRAEQQLDRLDELKAALETELRAVRQTVDAGTAEVRERVQALLRDLRNTRNQLVDQLPALRSPDSVLLAPDWSLRQDVAQKAADLVMAWPEWDSILSCVQDGVVVPVPPDGGWTGPPDPEAAPLPQVLGDFAPAFVRTCDELRDYARQRALDGITRWLNARSAAPPTVRLRQRAAAMLDPQVQERLASGPLARSRAAIDLVVDPAELAGDIAGTLSLPDQPGAGREAFPLRAEQQASWADGGTADEITRHLIRVLRTRSALIDSATEHASRCLDAVQGRIVERLRGRYLRRDAQLPDGRQQRQFTAAVLGGHAGPREQPPDPAGALAALRRPEGASGSGG